MHVLYAILLAIVEGVTEFLPISSTGHLILVSNLLKLPQTEFIKSFEIIIQLGAILAVVAMYWKTLWEKKSLWPRIIIAFIPTAFVGFFLYDYIRGFLLGNTTVTLVALLIGGIILILVERFYKEEKHHVQSPEKLSYKASFLIGVVQSLSVIPGVSRSASSILGGMFLGASRKTAVEFSFFLAIPTVMAASGLDLLKSNLSFSLYEWNILLVGFTGSFLVAHFVIKFFLAYVQKHSFTVFGVYRIILAIVYWLLLIR